MMMLSDFVRSAKVEAGGNAVSQDTHARLMTWARERVTCARGADDVTSPVTSFNFHVASLAGGGADRRTDDGRAADATQHTTVTDTVHLSNP